MRTSRIQDGSIIVGRRTVTVTHSLIDEFAGELVNLGTITWKGRTALVSRRGGGDVWMLVTADVHAYYLDTCKDQRAKMEAR